MTRSREARLRPVPPAILRLVAQERVKFSRKAWQEVQGPFFAVADVLHALLNGVVVKRERDETGQARFKYTVHGPSLGGRTVYCAGKVIADEDEALFFVITNHWVRSR